MNKDRWFLRRVTAATALGEGLDGYDLGAISIVLPTITTKLSLSSTLDGLVGASTLIGIFIGAPLFGQLTDRFGRRKLFLADIIAFIVLGAIQIFVTNWPELLAVRLLLGIAIGAEYAIGPAMLAELSPSKGRGSRLSYLQVCWYVGYVLSVVLAYVLTDLGLSWGEVLATSAVPALITLALRHGLPESPRWLMSVGRAEQARAIVREHLGGDEYFESEDLAGETARRGSIRDLFAPGMRRRTAFVCIFWAALVAPYFAIFTFAPEVFSSLGIHNVRVTTIAANALAAVGALGGMLLIERVGRRPMLIVCFWVTGAALLVVGGWSAAPGAIVVICFGVFSLFNAAQGDLTGVYPSEVFPSEVRASGVGLAAAASRVGAAAGTFLLPIGIDWIGIGPCMIIGAVVCFGGAFVSHLWAPETDGKSLTHTGSATATPRVTAPAGAPAR